MNRSRIKSCAVCRLKYTNLSKDEILKFLNSVAQLFNHTTDCRLKSLATCLLLLFPIQALSDKVSDDPITPRSLTASEIRTLNGTAGQTGVENFPTHTNSIPGLSASGRNELRDELSRLGSARVLVTFAAPIIPFAGNSNRDIHEPIIQDALTLGVGRIVRRYQHLPVYSIEVDSQALQGLLNSPDVINIEMDQQVQMFHESTTPIVSSDILNLHSTTGANWNGGSGDWSVAIIDSGVRISHAAFAGRVLTEACFHLDASCPNGQINQVGPGAGCTESCLHGTHVAGTAIGDFTTTGLLSANGIAPGANLHIVDVFPANGGFFSDVIAGLDHVSDLVANGARIASANMSLGNIGRQWTGNCDTDWTALSTSVNLLRNQGVLVVAAAGNDSNTDGMSSPACLSGAYSVGATNDNDTVAGFSNVSQTTDIWAPGVNVVSASNANDAALATLQGTSMATPHVAGSAALLRECFVTPGSSNNSPTIDDVIAQALTSGGVSVVDGRFGGTHVKPRLDLLGALQSIRPNDSFGNPIPLAPGSSGNQLGLNTCATSEASEPSHNSGSTTTGSVWFAYSVPATGIYEFSTCDSATSFDTVLAMYRGNTLSNLNLIDSNDDDSSGSNNCSTISGTLNAGEVIYIAVSGYGSPNTPIGTGHTGIFNLSWSQQLAATKLCAGHPVTVDLSVGESPTQNDDVILGTIGPDTIFGLGGDDIICGGNGNDLIYGGVGNDTIYAGAQDDTIYGGNGADVIWAGTGDDFAYGGFDQSQDTIYGQNGADFLYDQGGYGFTYGGAGNDNIFTGADGGYASGGNNADTINGSNTIDVIYGLDGNDQINGWAGDDFLYGGNSRDTIDGGGGNDLISGGPFNDILIGGIGNDTIDGGSENDDISGGSGNDILAGGAGNDDIYGGAGIDTLNGGPGNDFLNGQAGNDTCNGGTGNDTVTVTCESTTGVLQVSSSVQTNQNNLPSNLLPSNPIPENILQLLNSCDESPSECLSDEQLSRL